MHGVDFTWMFQDIFFQRNTSFEADERTNQLIVYTPADNQAMVQRIIKSLDIDVPALVKSEAYYVKHGEAKTICEMVKKIVSGQIEKAKEAEKTTAANRPQTLPFGQKPAIFKRDHGRI